MIVCPCGSEVQSAYICRTCTGRLRRDLQRLADLWGDSENVLTRQTATGSGGKTGKGSTKTAPLPFDANASEVRWMVENAVTTWVRDIAGDDIPDTVRDVPTAALWLSQNAQKIAGVPQGPEALDELTDTYRQIVRLVDRPESPVYLGTHACGSDVWAKSHHNYKTCDCGEVLDLGEMRGQATLRARQVWATAREICAAAHMFDVPINKMMISRWYREGVIPPAAVRNSDDGRALQFRVGIVVDLAKNHAATRAEVS